MQVEGPLNENPRLGTFKAATRVEARLSKDAVSFKCKKFLICLYSLAHPAAKLRELC